MSLGVHGLKSFKFVVPVQSIRVKGNGIYTDGLISNLSDNYNVNTQYNRIILIVTKTWYSFFNSSCIFHTSNVRGGQGLFVQRLRFFIPCTLLCLWKNYVVKCN